MSDPQSEKFPDPPDAATPSPPGVTPPRQAPAEPLEARTEEIAPAALPRPSAIPPAPRTPVTRKKQATKERRGFFSDAMREVLSPFAGAIERKINPVLEALESIPQQAEKLAKIDARALDQLHTKIPLPLHTNGRSKGRSQPAREQTHLRPPGAMKPGEFESVCSRCGKCVEACPANAIQLDPNGLTADGFPYIVAEEQPCVVCDDLSCMKSCPTGALKLVDRLEIDMGTAKVDHTQCLRDNGEACTLCLEVCPIVEGDRAAIFASPHSGKIVVRKNVCIGCGLCENRCPTEPRAITVVPYVPPADPIVA